ncbi:MAG TPA: WYL domain-containing protein [Jiangellaceae bacterium]
MNRTDRLYAIAEELRAAGNHGRTGQWLADRLEVSPRTIKRDVSALQQAGAPIWAQAGPGGGYVLDGRATLPPVNFTEAEAVALAVALAAGRELPFAADGRSALAKVLAAMPPTARAGTDSLANRLWTRGHGKLARSAVARPIEEALRRRVVLTLEYTDTAGEITVRDVEPVALANTGGYWYLIGFCRLRQAPRWFRTDRIKAAHLTAEPAPDHDPVTFAGEPPDDAAPVLNRH